MTDEQELRTIKGSGWYRMTRNWPHGTDSTVIHVHAGPLTRSLVAFTSKMGKNRG